MTRTETTNVGGLISVRNLLLREATSPSTSRELGIWQRFIDPLQNNNKNLKRKNIPKINGHFADSDCQPNEYLGGRL